MKYRKKLLTFGLAALTAFGLAQPALASDTVNEPLLDSQELTEIMDEFRAEHGLNEKNFSMAYCYTGTGETWYYNEDSYFQAASLFKVPMMMCLMEEVSSGNMTMADDIYGVPMETLLDSILLHSNNDYALLVTNYYQPYENFRAKLAKLAEINTDGLPGDFYVQNVTSARFMMNVLKKLYESPETYPGILDRMKEAQPNEFFRLNLEGQYTIAQKYGKYMGDTHTAGIIYTPTPCILVVMTELCDQPREVIAEAAELMAEYSITLDERQTQREQQAREAAEKALAEKRAEEARIKAEQEAAEQARLEAELAAQKAAEEEAARLEAIRLEEEALAAKRQLTIKLTLIGCIVVALGIGTILVIRKHKKT